MAILAYMFLVGISLLLFIAMSILYKRSKIKILAIAFYIVTGLLIYSLISTLVFVSSDSYSNKSSLLYSEEDFLTGTDRIYLFEDKTFKIEYNDHLYHGVYRFANNRLTLDIDCNILLPFRSALPENYEITNNRMTDIKTGNTYFGVCKEQELKRLH